MAHESVVESFKQMNIKFLEETKDNFFKEVELYVSRIKSDIQENGQMGGEAMIQALKLMTVPAPAPSHNKAGMHQNEAVEDKQMYLNMFRGLKTQMKKIKEQLRKERRMRKALQSKLDQQQEVNHLYISRLSAVDKFLKTTSQKEPTDLRKPPRLARLKNSFDVTVASDHHKPWIHDIIFLCGGLILLTDESNSCLKCFDDKGNLLHKIRTTAGSCRVADVGDGRVVLVNRDARTMDVLKVSVAEIVKESTTLIENKYHCVAALNSHTLAAAVYSKPQIDILSLSGQILRSIETREVVNFASPTADVSLVCTLINKKVVKLDVASGTETMRKYIPGSGILGGVAPTRDNSVIVCDEDKKTLHLLDKDGNLVNSLWSKPEQDDSGELWWLSLLDNRIVCCSVWKVYVLELLY